MKNKKAQLASKEEMLGLGLIGANAKHVFAALQYFGEQVWKGNPDFSAELLSEMFSEFSGFEDSSTKAQMLERLSATLTGSSLQGSIVAFMRSVDAIMTTLYERLRAEGGEKRQRAVKLPVDKKGEVKYSKG